MKNNVPNVPLLLSRKQMGSFDSVTGVSQGLKGSEGVGE
jgi:hypothetical protein